MSNPSCRLYLITPPAIDDLAGFGRALEQALDAGNIGALQLRLKDASDREIAVAAGLMRSLLRGRNVPLILNDRPDLAVELGCDGVHIGQDDAPYDEARRWVGCDAIVGVTCHDSRHLAWRRPRPAPTMSPSGPFSTPRPRPPRPAAAWRCWRSGCRSFWWSFACWHGAPPLIFECREECLRALELAFINKT